MEDLIILQNNILHISICHFRQLNFHYILKRDKSVIFKNCPLYFFFKMKGAHGGLLPHFNLLLEISWRFITWECCSWKQLAGQQSMVTYPLVKRNKEVLLWKWDWEDLQTSVAVSDKGFSGTYLSVKQLLLFNILFSYISVFHTFSQVCVQF